MMGPVSVHAASSAGAVLMFVCFQLIVGLADTFQLVTHHHHHHQHHRHNYGGRGTMLDNKRRRGRLSKATGLTLPIPPHRSQTTATLLPAMPLIDDQWGLYAVVASSAALATRFERTTILGNAFSGPVTAMLITALLTNIGILPANGSIYLSSLQSFVLRLATPMLLLGADLKTIFQETGVMLRGFLLGTVGTMLGSLIGYFLLSGPLSSLGVPQNGDSWKIAAAITAKNIGGGLNFFAVSETLKVTPLVLSMGLACDNLLGLIYFPLISSLGKPYDANIESKDITEHSSNNNTFRECIHSGPISTKHSSSSGSSSSPSLAPVVSEHVGQLDDVEQTLSALAVGFLTAASAEMICSALNQPSLSLPVSTLIAVTFATTAPDLLRPLIPAGETVGKILLMFFFASVGNASGTVSATVGAKGAIFLLLFGLILYACHLTVVLGLGSILKIPMPDLLMASNANIGNAATAVSLASSKNWKSRLLPGLLVGTFGNAIATFIGLSMGTAVLKPLSGL